MAPALALLLATAALLALASGGGPTFPSPPAVVVALCQALEGRGESAPLPPSAIANQDLGIRALKVLKVGGSWPPSAKDSRKKRDFWAGVTSLAARVRAGEIVCRQLDDGEGDSNEGDPNEGDPNEGDSNEGDPNEGDSNEGPAIVPTLGAIQRAICSILLPLADAADHYLERGSLPAAAAQEVTEAAIGSLGASSSSVSSAVLAAATDFALDVIEGRTSCAIEDQIIAPAPNAAPGRWYQIKKGDNLLTIAGSAYGVSAGSARRLELAREINDHAYNQGLHVPANGWNAANIGPTMVSFFNKWRSNPKTLLQRYEAGSAYAVVYLPEL